MRPDRRRSFLRGISSTWHPQPNNWPPTFSLANFAKATELKKRLWFTLGALILFRLLSFVPMPGIDPRAMSALYQTQRAASSTSSTPSPAARCRASSIVALGVMPYITASIVVQLGATLYGPWQALKKEGETGRKKLNQYTRYLTVADHAGAGLFHRRRPRSLRARPGHQRGGRAGHAVPRRRHRSASSAAPCS